MRGAGTVRPLNQSLSDSGKLAYRGFIAVAQEGYGRGPSLLIPEIQKKQCVLDWAGILPPPVPPSPFLRENVCSQNLAKVHGRVWH